MSRLRVYVASPISIGDLQTNIDRAREAGVQLLRAGFAPWVPALTAFMGGNTPEKMPCGTTHEDWMGVDLPWVEVCDILLRLPGESKGADMEVACAQDNSIPVFSTVADVIAYRDSQPIFTQDTVPSEATRRRDILDQIAQCVCKDRQQTYGDAEDNFADIAGLASIVLARKLKEPLENLDIATLMICVKLARIKTSPLHADNWIDSGGYAVCGGVIAQKKAEANK